MMVGIHLAAMDEAYAFATKAGLDPKLSLMPFTAASHRAP